jgi:DNA-binding transcriptional regulator YiaG
MSKFGKEIARRLKKFVDLADASQNLKEAFTCKTLTLELGCKTHSAADVISIRKSLGASQVIFARFLGVAVNTVRAWEQGINEPSPIACRFMDEMKLNPEYWRGRLRQSAKWKHPARA